MGQNYGLCEQEAFAIFSKAFVIVVMWGREGFRYCCMGAIGGRKRQVVSGLGVAWCLSPARDGML